MFTRSIRWRIQLWLAFLLICVLSGFGATVYQLYRLSYFDQLDEELARRVAALSADVRGRGPGGPPGGPGKGPPPMDESRRPFRGPGDHFFRERGGPREFNRSGGPPLDDGWGRGGPHHRGEGFRDGPEGGPKREIRFSSGTTA